jgi:RNA recognition motif-containing protein
MINVSNNIIKKNTRIIFVGGLHSSITQTELKIMFLPFGSISNIDLPEPITPDEEVNDAIQAHTSKNRGYGFVEYEDINDTIHAINNMNQSIYKNRILTVDYAKENNYQPIWQQKGKAV